MEEFEEKENVKRLSRRTGKEGIAKQKEQEKEY